MTDQKPKLNGVVPSVRNDKRRVRRRPEWWMIKVSFRDTLKGSLVDQSHIKARTGLTVKYLQQNAVVIDQSIFMAFPLTPQSIASGPRIHHSGWR